MQSNPHLNINQTLYWKVKEIQWCKSLSHLKNMIVMLGQFHTTMLFNGTIGYLMRYSDFVSIPKLTYADHTGNYCVLFV